MAGRKLRTRNVQILLDQYRSERERLLFQLANVREMIARLKGVAGEAEEEGGGELARRGPGRPRSEPATPPTGRKRGRPRKNPDAPPAKPGRKKRKRPEGYRLSPWDQMVIDTIGKEGLLPKEVIVERARTWARTNARKMSAPEVEAKITRVLQKLSGKKGVLGTHRTGLRRGYHYGLKEWFFRSSGSLRRQHLDKLVIESKLDG